MKRKWALALHGQAVMTVGYVEPVTEEEARLLIDAIKGVGWEQRGWQLLPVESSFCIRCAQSIKRHGPCYHCRFSWLCHSCGKSENYGRAYGL